MGLPTADRSESMGLCFVGERGKFERFLCTSFLLYSTYALTDVTHSASAAQYIPSKPGPILLYPDNIRVGTHNGLWTFTIGQNARIPGRLKKLFVARKSVENNAITVVDAVWVQPCGSMGGND